MTRMKILIPVARGTHKDPDSSYSKAMYEIERKTILQYVCEFLSTIHNASFVFITHRDDVEQYHFNDIISLLVPDAKIVVAQGSTKGSACSCLLALDYLETDEPLVIAGSDQLLTINLQDVLDKFIEKKYDGGVIIFEDIHPRWSYVKLDAHGYVVEAAEKHPISKHATTGFYYYRRGEDFVRSAMDMIKKGASVNGQFYVCPAYNEMILKQKKIGVYPIEKQQYYNLNHPKGIDAFESHLRGGEKRNAYKQA